MWLSWNIKYIHRYTENRRIINRNRHISLGMSQLLSKPRRKKKWWSWSYYFEKKINRVSSSFLLIRRLIKTAVWKNKRTKNRNLSYSTDMIINVSVCPCVCVCVWCLQETSTFTLFEVIFNGIETQMINFDVLSCVYCLSYQTNDLFERDKQTRRKERKDEENRLTEQTWCDVFNAYRLKWQS